MIRTEKLSKKYRKVEALKNLNLHVQKGSVFGFIGPNGAGKSTTMLILSTLLRPTSGRAWVAGMDVIKQANEVRRVIGYMPDFFGVYDNLTAAEYLAFYASSYGIPRHQQQPIIDDLLELVNLTDKRDLQVDGLSRGMKQRLGLARALVHDPQLLILDEPASGLDPRARIEFREILKELQLMGKTVMISSHILPELMGLCDAIGIMEKGELVAYGNVDEIQAQFKGSRTIKVFVTDRLDDTVKVLEVEQKVNSIQVNADQQFVTVGVEGDDRVQAELLARLVGEGIPVFRFEETAVNLEDVFLEITSGAKEGEE